MIKTSIALIAVFVASMTISCDNSGLESSKILGEAVSSGKGDGQIVTWQAYTWEDGSIRTIGATSNGKTVGEVSISGDEFGNVKVAVLYPEEGFLLIDPKGNAIYNSIPRTEEMSSMLSNAMEAFGPYMQGDDEKVDSDRRSFVFGLAMVGTCFSCVSTAASGAGSLLAACFCVSCVSWFSIWLNSAK